MTQYNMAEGLKEKIAELNLSFNEDIINKFLKTTELLLEANKIHKFTTITEAEEMVVKHYMDSLTASKYLFDNAKVIDLGAGAGFPSLPLKFINDSLDFTLLDSLKKRVDYLDNVIKTLSLTKIKAVHARCEDVDTLNLRENFDFVIARGLSALPTLLEYAIPYLKTGGKLIAYKAEKAEEELENSKNALKLLNAETVKLDEFLLNGEYKRALIIIEKKGKCDKKYPRGQNKPRISPL